ncbi:M1 family metallopeptidase [Carboxylicivirga caseinilyticus]|uniref:M1 family metallopeptidase n=1 Tax=Carboxylicivirga caseinilyticus TaxID=3417572 RepID=UPI003D33F28D|nr:hypothetical protein [Marinilabiliaceae bacterium A049]
MKLQPLLTLLVSIIFIYSCQFIPEKWPEDGVSLPLAKERASRISNLDYALSMSVPDEVSEPIEAQADLTFTLNNSSDDLFLDFKADSIQLKQVIINNDTVEPRIVNEHIILPKSSLDQNNKVLIDFTMGDGPLNRNDKYFYSLFVPDRARTAIPCFDQPDIKGQFSVTMTIPQKWEAIANGLPVMTQDLENGRKTVEFARSKPISTYLWAFAAGAFKQETIDWNGKQVGLYHMVDDTIKLQGNLKTIFSQTTKSLDWLQDYTNYTYPYDNYNLVAIPSFQFGGMEHPGATYYRSELIFLDENPTQNEEIRRANLIAHETAHMWFGDLVTMAWFEEVWLKEVFANFMADKITQPWFQDINYDLQFLLAHFPSAYSVDRTEGANPVNQKLHNLKNAGSLYGAIIYHKSPIVMAQLENMVGQDKLQTGIQEYIKKYAFSNATWNDLITCIDKLTENDLTVWSHNWVNEPGRPVITMRPPDENNDSWMLSQFPEHPEMTSQGTYWPQEVSIITDTTKSFIEYFDATVSIDEKIALPNTLFFSDAMGYGLFRMNGQQINYWMRHTSDLDDPLLRGRSVINLFENFLDANINSEDYITFLLNSINKEKDPLLINLYGSQLKEVFWKNIPQEKWSKTSQSISKVLLSKAEISTESSVKKILLRLWINLALDNESYQLMASLCDKNNNFFGTALSDRDRIELVAQLAIKQYDSWEVNYNTVINQLTNDDLKQMMIFALPALSNVSKERDLFWASLTDPKNRAKEKWVELSLSYLHHPLRQKHSINYLLQTLNMLEEIQVTGDIFFPIGWLSNSIGQYSSEDAVAIANKFLADHPKYPHHLKNKILQNIDLAKRSISISKQFNANAN